MKNKSTFFKNSINLVFVCCLAVAVLPISGCGEDEEASAPGADKRCRVKVTLYYPKWDAGKNEWINKGPDESWGTVKADGNGNCPPPITETKYQ